MAGRWTRLCGAAAAVAAALLGSARGAAAAPRSVLFIAVDDLRPELGAYGAAHMVTPNIDALAASAVTFARAFVQQAVCSPSRTSFLTGRFPDTTHIYDLWAYFRQTMTDGWNVTTLPQYFKEAAGGNYVVAGQGKIFHPGAGRLLSLCLCGVRAALLRESRW